MTVVTTLLTQWVLFADQVAPAAEDAGSNILMALMPWLAIGFLFYLLMIRPQRRDRDRRKAMLDAVKKNDRIVTSGGIHGVVVNVNAEAGEVTIKVDEATGTKLKVALGSVSQVITDEPSEDGSK